MGKYRNAGETRRRKYVSINCKQRGREKTEGAGFLNNRGTDEFSARVITVNGKVTAAQHRCMAEAAEKFGNGNLTYTTRLSVEIQGIPYEKIEEFQEFIAKEGLETGGTGAKVRPVVSCKGTTCQYGLLDSYAISEEIFRRFYKGYRQVALPHKFKIAVGGCPNNCVKPNLNDVGIIGQRIPHFDSEACKGCKNVPLKLHVQTKWRKSLTGNCTLMRSFADTAEGVWENVHSIPSRTVPTDSRSISVDAGERKFLMERP